MEFVIVRRIVAVLLLSLPFVAAGAGEVRAGDEAKAGALRTSRAAWSVREARVQDSKRLRRTASVKKAGAAKSGTKMGFSTFTRVGDSRKISVFRYATPLSLGPSDFILKVRAPGGRRSLMQVELMF